MMIDRIQSVIVNAPFLAVFIVLAAGFLASLSSCTLIRIPIVFGYVSGAAVSRRHSFLLSLCLTAGMIVSYTLLGIFLIILKNVTFDMVRISRYVYLFLGLILFCAGLFYAGLVPGSDRHLACKANGKLQKAGLAGAFIFGVTFAFMEMPACPCCASVLFVIVSLVGVWDSWIYSFIIFFSFAVGQSLPILLIGCSTRLVNALAPKVARMEKYIQFAAGMILIAVSVFFFILA